MAFKDVEAEVYGGIFGIFILTLTYFMIRFSNLVVDSGAISNYVENLSTGKADLLPIPVFIAVLLFIVREFIDWLKSKRIKSQKITAYKQLIAEEIELNYGSLKSLRNIFEELENNKEAWSGAKYKAVFKESNNLYVHVSLDGKLLMSAPALMPRKEQYDKILVPIAETSLDLYENVHQGYKQINELFHLYGSLIKGLKAKEFEEPFPHDITKSGFLSYALKECEAINSGIGALYQNCTGSELKKSRIR